MEPLRLDRAAQCLPAVGPAAVQSVCKLLLIAHHKSENALSGL
jgi:hypothetical protein